MQETDNSGLTKIKRNFRSEVINNNLLFSNALKAHANAVKNVDLKTKVNYTKSDLNKTADKVLYDIGILLLGLARSVGATLMAKYFVGEDEMTAMETLLADFKASIPQKRVADSVSKASIGNIGGLIDSIDLLLKEEMDVLVAVFQHSHPDFYKEYLNARNIVGYIGRGKSNNNDTPPKP